MREIAAGGRYRVEGSTPIKKREAVELLDGKSHGDSTLYEANNGRFFVVERFQIGLNEKGFEEYRERFWLLTPDEAKEWKKKPD